MAILDRCSAAGRIASQWLCLFSTLCTVVSPIIKPAILQQKIIDADIADRDRKVTTGQVIVSHKMAMTKLFARFDQRCHRGKIGAVQPDHRFTRYRANLADHAFDTADKRCWHV